MKRKRIPKPPPSPIQALMARYDNANQAAARNRFRDQSPEFPEGEQEQLAELAYDDALALASLVREEDPRVLFGALSEYSHGRLSVLAVVLAALLPLDVPESELTWWMTWAPQARAG